jgi:toxin ParE1/3/4
MEIRFSQNALSDLYAIYDYIALENPAYAQKILKRIEVAVDRLADHPQLGRVSRVKDVRELIISDTS